MSLIGPHPHPLNMAAGGVPYSKLVPYYDLRHTMRPGLSVWAQARGCVGRPTIPKLPGPASSTISPISRTSPYGSIAAFW